MLQLIWSMDLIHLHNNAKTQMSK